MSKLKLYSKEELVSEYRLSIENNKEKIIETLKVASLAVFSLRGLISEEQKDEWSTLGRTICREEPYRRLICFVLDKNSVEDYLKFSRCVQYTNNVKALIIFPFIRDLVAVGLHDSLKKGNK